ncbi:hypothetical protein GCM10012290_11910 [Halolactibacillus alkaliphilus]|uniref:Uncharacterized protein n=1 Tax=Halolactibacillus alkaliphilus TaxID=442899 RepID=A0A511X0R0_9BACI|nr:hypothetical protein [Halolactibacillus alkaliphilus]GEN56547.1 hypothetical protein HAL01_10110 [Halolactibacillus alkaliphilus]GGN69316.1 hypothetical protein GCM10012290_11910 [Halolactibacillus alkaliphilus]SFO75024.1 hypothetical protein SAMN05720591_10856 [Halolactibacillus alkaliphilus]
MRIKKSISKNSISYSIIENVRDINGKSTTRVIEALGNEQEIREKQPGVDSEEWARQYAMKLTEEQKRQRELSIIKLNAEKLIDADKQRSFNVGYLFLQSLYYQLGLSKMTQDIQSKYKF